MSNIIFTNNALKKMGSWNLSEKEVLDAFYHGEAQTPLLTNTRQAVWSNLLRRQNILQDCQCLEAIL